MVSKNKPLSAASDTLAKAAAKAGISQLALNSARAWLAEQLVAHEYAKLGQGGHVDSQVPLRRVFVDLPVTDGQNVVSQHDPRQYFLSELLSSPPLNLSDYFNLRSIGCLSSSNLEDVVESDGLQFKGRAERHHCKSDLGATLLIGGPGQGKSTLGQLACQVHRAALLKAVESELTSAQRDLVNSFGSVTQKGMSLQQRQSLGFPKSPFLPLQISLPDLAAWLAKVPPNMVNEQLPVLLCFLADLPSAKTCALSADILLALASNMPSLLVLDGFDEVGATQDRERIVAVARDLLLLLARRGASTQVVATTRPQGYAGELSQICVSFRILYLSPLRKEEALEYARKLVDAKISSADLRETTYARLLEAAAEPATERLLTTPLQVTILTALVQHLGRAPRERWNLFSRYFGYTYDREIERNSYASQLLADHRTHIERIHARVALLLQVEAERDGGASARMSGERLKEVIEAVLSEDEVSVDERKYLVGEIAVAAEQRLVFLVEPEPGSFGFEIRSLQEFMAAWALTSGRDTEVEARLQQVAKAPMFRNVALFAASRLFSEGSPLRDVLADRICGSLDNDSDDELFCFTRAGGLLALETLEEGAVLSQPKRARALMTRATGLLSLPPGNEHVRLARVANSDTTVVLQNAIEQTLGCNQNECKFNPQAAWVCLIDATNRNEKWAIELGDKFWSKLDEVPLLLNVCDRVQIPIGRWVATKLEHSAEVISPECFVNMPVIPLEPGISHNWVSWLVEVNEKRERCRRAGRFWGGHPLMTCQALDKIIPTHPVPTPWKVWVMAAQFEIEPNASQLAKTLLAVAKGIPVSEWQGLQWFSSWPLFTCLAAAETPAELCGFAEKLLSGELGDTADWRNAEKSWNVKRDLAAVLDYATEAIPWSKESIKQAPPLFGFPAWKVLSSAGGNALTIQTLLSKAKHAFQKNCSPKIKQRLAEICLDFLGYVSTGASIKNFDVSELLEAAPGNVLFLFPRPKFLSLTKWKSLLDFLARQKNQVLYAELSETLDALNIFPGHPFLLRLAVSSLELCSRHIPFSRQLTPAQITKAADSLSRQETNSQEAKADLAILRIFFGSVPEGQDLDFFHIIAKATVGIPSLWKALLNALHGSRLSKPRIRVLLVKTYLGMGVSHSHAHIAVEQLRDALQNRKSDLDNFATWNRLALPLPYPKSPVQPRLEGGIPLRPIRFESLELRDIGGLHHLKLSFTPPADDKGQWVVILGPNGIGKTTLLRSLVLALRSVNDPAIWPKGAFAHSWQRVCEIDEARLIDSTIIVKLGDGVEHKTLIRQNDSISITQLPEQNHPRLFPLFAYGCRRGSALGGTARQVNLTDDDGPEVATLFDEGADLIHAETWLLQLEGDASKNPRSKTIFESVIGAMKDLLDLVSVEVAERKVWVTEHGRPKLLFSSLSDGYLTSAGWFLDLVARWITLADRYHHTIEEGFLARMRGLVLIDEIDLHLHPRWQIEIIARTRRLLPQMSFVVTTHNPLTLVGAKAEEIWVLSTEDGRVKATCGVETPLFLTGGQIYRRYFGIEDIYPDGLGRTLQRYAFLSGYALRNDDEQNELERLQKQLRDAQIEPGWDVVARTEPRSESAVVTAPKRAISRKKRGTA
ncbi:MAG: AAA family ATPase [Candidatus Riflebacteria bacterium]|nr:AAA family ATPase [Candidatus Riflebacteria bacterium]